MNAFTRRNFLKTTSIGAVASTNSLCRGQDESGFKDRIHVGLITQQSAGNDRMIMGLAGILGVRVCAISDLGESSARGFAGILKHTGHTNVSCYSDYRKMLAEEAKLDAVIVMSPEWRRVGECVDCLEAGKHV